MDVYTALHGAWGPQGWWPARTPFEMMVGAILTQNTAWTNVEKAIANLRTAKRLTPKALAATPGGELAALIRPAGYFNVKAHRLHDFTCWFIETYGGSIRRMQKRPTAILRDELLSVRGIGRETADSILLYALHRPVFVIDAYTRRFMERHNWLVPRTDYDAVAAIMTTHLGDLPESGKTPLYNEFHALIVALAKRHCRTRARCTDCPLQPWLPS